MPEAATRSRLAVFMFTDITGSTAMKSRLGTAAYAGLLRQHNDTFHGILSNVAGSTELENPGDGFLARFLTASRFPTCRTPTPLTR